MFRLNCKITITNEAKDEFITIRSVHEIEIMSSRLNLTDTARITMARNVSVANFNSNFDLTRINISQYLKRGMKVVIMLGYDEDLVTMFTGYIARIDAKIPFTIFCEDEMWKLKQTNFAKCFTDAKVIDIVNYIYPGEKKSLIFISVGL